MNENKNWYIIKNETLKMLLILYIYPYLQKKYKYVNLYDTLFYDFSYYFSILWQKIR